MHKRRAKNQYTGDNHVTLVRGGKAYFETLVQLIQEAKHSIHLQTYIFDGDQTGRLVADALAEAAKRNVAVYLLPDGYASRHMAKQVIQLLEQSHVHFRFFEPLFRSRSFYFGRRLHHKVVVADANTALVGGVNISDKYNDLPEQAAWLDFAVLVKGPVAFELCNLCRQIWKGFSKNENAIGCRNDHHIEKGNSLVRIRRNDWVYRKNQVSKTYLEMFHQAHSHIIILCSYFLPGDIIRKSLKRACQRGIKVKVVVAGKSDLWLAKNAERYMYDWLLRNGVELYEYEKNILHGKIAVCDDEWLTIGSYNINDISAYASVELNLDVKDAAFAKDTASVLNTIMNEECIKVSKELHLKNKGLLAQFFRWCAYRIFRFIFFLFTFYFRQVH